MYKVHRRSVIGYEHELHPSFKKTPEIDTILCRKTKWAASISSFENKFFTTDPALRIRL